MSMQDVVNKLADSISTTYGEGAEIPADAVAGSVETDLNNDTEDGVFNDLVDCVVEELENRGYTVIDEPESRCAAEDGDEGEDECEGDGEADA